MYDYTGDAGHNCIPDSGAVGIRVEDQLTKELWGLVQSKLKQLGYTVLDCTPYGQSFNKVGGSLGYRVRIANENGSKLHICIHFNATPGGHGVEVYATSAAGREVAQRVCNEISKLGYTNRGVKDGSELFVVKYTYMPSILIECAFVDSAEDMNRYNAEAMANAIVKGITGQEVIKESEEFDMNDIVLYFGDADVFAAIMKAQRMRCPLMKESDFNASGLKAENKVIIGGPNGTIKGDDRFKTFKAVGNTF